MLIGEYRHSLDIKGRVNFPAKIREELGDSFIICKGLGDKCLYVYSIEEWGRLEEKIKDLPISKSRMLQRFLFSGAIKAVPDKQGRIVIPTNLREYAEIESEIVVAGASTRAEIWNAEVWDENAKLITPEMLEETMLDLNF
ncbi:MAG: division/cell wall cluster transcriptional repressor MraZ [Oscillospiraceae bacterium]